MGSGKSHTLEWLHAQHAFPLEAFVRVDPDHIRELLPEFYQYTAIDPTTAGEYTQKEVGYISEILVLSALEAGCSVLVDGSLRDHDWHTMYFYKLRNLHPKLKIAIIEVKSSLITSLRRARQRSLQTGRTVPDRIHHAAHNQISESVERLKSLVDFACTISNEYDHEDPILVDVSGGECSLSGLRVIWWHVADSVACNAENTDGMAVNSILEVKKHAKVVTIADWEGGEEHVNIKRRILCTA